MKRYGRSNESHLFREDKTIMVRVGFSLLGREGWHAGFIYIANLIHASRLIKDDDTDFSLLLTEKDTYVPEDIQEPLS